VNPSDERGLHRVPLRELTVDDLEMLAFRAMTTFGDEQDYRHFLPRILELASFGRTPHIGFDLWLIGNKLTYGRWTTWPADEQAAISEWVQAMFDEEDDRRDEIAKLAENAGLRLPA